MILSALINQYLAKDPEVAERLSEHQSKVLKIELMPFRKSFFVLIHENFISLSRHTAHAPHAAIQGTPLGLLRAGLSEDNILPENIILTGDILFIQSLKNIFRDIDIDWTEVLSHFTGDTFAYAISQVFCRVNYYRAQASQNFKRNLTEYLQEERRVLVPRAELEDFYKAVEEVRDNMERLEARCRLMNL